MIIYDPVKYKIREEKMEISFSCEYCFYVIVTYVLFPVKNFDYRSIVVLCVLLYKKSCS